jgi:hypothetical protein
LARVIRDSVANSAAKQAPRIVTDMQAQVASIDQQRAEARRSMAPTSPRSRANTGLARHRVSIFRRQQTDPKSQTVDDYSSVSASSEYAHPYTITTTTSSERSSIGDAAMLAEETLERRDSGTVAMTAQTKSPLPASSSLASTVESRKAQKKPGLLGSLARAFGRTPKASAPEPSTPPSISPNKLYSEAPASQAGSSPPAHSPNLSSTSPTLPRAAKHRDEADELFDMIQLAQNNQLLRSTTTQSAALAEFLLGEDIDASPRPAPVLTQSRQPSLSTSTSKSQLPSRQWTRDSYKHALRHEIQPPSPGMLKLAALRESEEQLISLTISPPLDDAAAITTRHSADDATPSRRVTDATIVPLRHSADEVNPPRHRATLTSISPLHPSSDVDETSGEHGHEYPVEVSTEEGDEMTLTSTPPKPRKRHDSLQGLTLLTLEEVNNRHTRAPVPRPVHAPVVASLLHENPEAIRLSRIQSIRSSSSSGPSPRETFRDPRFSRTLTRISIDRGSSLSSSPPSSRPMSRVASLKLSRSASRSHERLRELVSATESGVVGLGFIQTEI